jgi:hypothetical protein
LDAAREKLLRPRVCPRAAAMLAARRRRWSDCLKEKVSVSSQGPVSADTPSPFRFWAYFI